MIDPAVNTLFDGAMTANDLELAHSVLDWWSLAGVDCDFGDDPMDLLEALRPVAEAPIVSPAVSATPSPKPTPEQAVTPAAPVASAPTPDFNWPDTLDDFRVWLATSPDVPGASLPASRVAPSGPTKARLFVLTAAPDAGDLVDGFVLGGAPGVLFDRMLAAIDLKRKDVVIASMAVSPLAGTRLAPTEIATLAEIARHHIALVAPKMVLVLGDKASRAILSTDVVVARGKLLEIKVKGLNIPSVATFHPRTLDRNQGFKRAAWETLQQVQKELTPS